ncbi:MAG: aldo/keto reductase [Chloroflexi bacterium]|nr:aldo/keto reductase [Chloroflexota bacterium]
MELRTLGNTGYQITPVGFGAWAIGGNGYKFGWGPQDDEDSIQTIHKALDAGINWIDTAAVYGLGHSEEVVGRALKGIQQKPYVFTKGARVWDDQRNIFDDQSAAGVRNQVEASLRRLQVETIDLFQFHWPRPDEQLEEGWRTLAELQREGKIRHLAVSNYSVAQMERLLKIAPISSLQPPYSIIRPDVEKAILPFCQQHNIGVIVYSPMQSGLLTGAMTPERVKSLPDDDWRKNNPQYQEPKLSRNLAVADLLTEIGKAHGRTTGEVAIAWTLRRPEVTAAIVGARHPGQIDGIIGAQEFRLSDDEIQRIADFVKKNP